jgi:bromodomain-containing factor 1
MSNEDNGVPPAEPSALKSLLNPISSEGATPSSTVPEAPKSPQQDPAPITESAPVEYQSLPPPANGDNSLPPLPTDAPVPPSPKAADEPPPVLPEGAIPPIVSTPSVITVETPAQEAAPMVAEPTPAPEVAAPPPAPESAPAPPAESAPAPPAEPAPGPPPAALLETAPAPNEPPAPAGVIEPAPTPAEPAAQAFAIPTSDGMDVDQPEPSPAGSLKRSGEDLEGREEKRTRDDEIEAPQAPAQASAPVPAPAPPAEAPAPQAQAPPVAEATAPAAQAQAPPPAPAPVSQSHIIVPGVGTVPVVIPPPPVASGPTTPLTLTQHKHMLSCIRSLKKNKDAALFLEPVNPVLFGIPHYPDIIKNPMDLGTVETKLIVSDPRGPPKDKSKMGKWDQSKGKYNSVADVSLDVRQIFWNTARFNGMDHVVTQAATRLDAVFAKMIANIPAEVSFTLRIWTELMYQPVIAPPPPPAAAGPSSHARRASVSQPPVIRRTSDVTDRPKREIHPPPSKDLAYADAPRKPKRRNDPQLQWALKTLKVLESTNKTYDMVLPFLYPVDQLMTMFPDYGSVIKRPIDLLIIKQRLMDGEYDDISQVDSDMKLMFSNALKYNAAQDPVAIAATQFQQLWAEKLRSVPPKYVSRDSSEDPIGGTPDYDSEDEHGMSIEQGCRT